MASNLDNLTAAKANLTAKLASVAADPKPTYSIDGVSFSWESYFRMLTDQLKAINTLITAEDPFIFKSQVL